MTARHQRKKLSNFSFLALCVYQLMNAGEKFGVCCYCVCVTAELFFPLCLLFTIQLSNSGSVHKQAISYGECKEDLSGIPLRFSLNWGIWRGLRRITLTGATV